MKIRKLLSITLLLAVFATVLNAQMSAFHIPKYKDVLALKDREVIVVVNPPDQKMMAKLEKKGTDGAINAYQQAIGDYNTFMKNAVTKFWNFNSKPVLYKTREEIKTLYQDKSQHGKYVFIYGSCLGGGPDHDFDWNMDKDGKKVEGTKVIFNVGGELDSPIYQCVPEELLPSSTSLAFFISETNFLFNYILGQQKDCNMKDMVAENGHLLSQKTLLLNSSTINKDFINDIKTAYPYTFKVFLPDNNEIGNAICSGDPNSAYIITTGEGNIFKNWVVSCADGAILAYSDFGKPVAFTLVKHGFDKDFFQEIAKFGQGTMKK